MRKFSGRDALHFMGVLPLLVGGFAGCTGQIASNGAGTDTPGGDGVPDGTGNGGAGSSGNPAPAPACNANGPSVGFAPLRRLTREEYNNTVLDLLGDNSKPALAFARDEIAGGFGTNSGTPIDDLQMGNYDDAATKLAKAAVTNRLAALLGGCDVKQRSCVDAFVDRFGAQAFRRPLDADQKTPLMALYDAATIRWGATEAMELVIEAILSSPYFLYHVEFVPAPGQIVALDNHELASRLSYFVWQSLPDGELSKAAQDGTLGDPITLEAHVRRMLANDRTRNALGSFFVQWMGLDGVQPFDSLYKDPARFPQWNAALAASMRNETLAFVDHVIRQDDANLKTLLSASYSFVDPSVAKIYGVSSPAADAPARVELDPARRSGLLSQPSLLTSHAHAAEASWVMRGRFVREQVLCQVLPPPPPTVDTTKASNDPNRLTNPECKGCHTQMDPIGLGFENFDALGRWQDNDGNGQPLGGVGDIIGDTDVAGEFRGVRELSTKLTASAQVGDCMATQWFRFAVGRGGSPEDECSIATTTRRFLDSGQDMRELIVAVVLSDAFRFHQGGNQ